jgi:SAM-dependent methyltransferase
MTLYERARLLLEPVLPPLYKQVRSRLKGIVKTNCRSSQILDVGGRKSPYTIGIPAQITIIDLPRDTELQHQLNLGISDRTFNQIHKRRSNIKEVVLGDMTRSDLPDETFDHVVSVEVLEHVEEDDLFVKEVSRVLKRGGVFLMTTPNGDWVENKNPDHKRHYKRRELTSLLEKYFDDVAVTYAVVGGRYRKLGLRSWSARHPVRTAASIFGNVINAIQSADREVEEKAAGTHHLIAAAKKH